MNDKEYFSFLIHIFHCAFIYPGVFILSFGLLLKFLEFIGCTF